MVMGTMQRSPSPGRRMTLALMERIVAALEEDPPPFWLDQGTVTQLRRLVAEEREDLMEPKHEGMSLQMAILEAAEDLSRASWRRVEGEDGGQAYQRAYEQLLDLIDQVPRTVEAQPRMREADG